MKVKDKDHADDDNGRGKHGQDFTQLSLPYLLLFFSSIVYLDFGTSKHMSLTFLTDGHQSKSQRRWNVRTSYIECNSPLAGLSFFLCDVQCNVKFQCNGVLRFQS